MSDDESGKMRVAAVAGRGKGRGFSPPTNPYGTPETTVKQQATD